MGEKTRNLWIQEYMIFILIRIKCQNLMRTNLRDVLVC